MERHIGTWYKENEPQKQEVAELVIDGNSVEFYSRFYDTSFPVTFIGSDGEYKYKVFANGSSKLSSNRLLKHTVSHRVFYVLMENFEFSRGIDISGIKEFSFSIPELIDWLGIKTVFYGSTDMDEMAAGEAYLEPIIINSHNPYIELYFESKTFNNSIIGDDRTQITIMKEPRIKVKYEQCQDINVIMNDIECLMQFWGLLIGRVTEAKDIRLSVEGQKLNSWLYFNRDFSYNTIVSNIHNKPRTYLYIVKDNIQNYFSNWRSFYYDASYSLIRRIYFSVNNKNSIFAEDIFVQYMRILDGYHSRISGDEETKMKTKRSSQSNKK